MGRRFTFIMYLIVALSFGCDKQMNDYIAASSISEKGFARDSAEMRKAHGQEIKIWGFVDHGNIFGNHDARKILGYWWSGNGPRATVWQFNLKASEEDATGHSFPVMVPNDSGRDSVLRMMLADAKARRPTRVLVKGRIYTYQAPANLARRVGLYMELQSSQAIRLNSLQQN